MPNQQIDLYKSLNTHWSNNLTSVDPSLKICTYRTLSSLLALYVLHIEHRHSPLTLSHMEWDQLIHKVAGRSIYFYESSQKHTHIGWPDQRKLWHDDVKIVIYLSQQD